MHAAAIGSGLAALALLSALIVSLMIKLGVLDIPGVRSAHDRPIPKGGGFGIAAAFVAGLLAACFAGLIPHQAYRVAFLLAAAILIIVVAWADDVYQFGFGTKLAAQIVAAALLTAGGFTIENVGPLPLGALGVPLTLVWLIFAINATNFIDGLNGLASGCMLIPSVVISTVALGDDDRFEAAALLPLAAGIVGFLPFNYPQAKVFMGDVGSQLCGLVVPAMAGPASRLPHHPWGVLIVPMAMAPILVDVAYTLASR